jgi:hypothetical protein
MISFNWMAETWESDTDKNFSVSMSTEGDGTDFDKTFEDEESFWKWYNNND